MTRTIMVAALIVGLSAFALSQTQNKRRALSQPEQELATLSQKAVADSIGKEIIVVEDTTSQTPLGAMPVAVVRGQFDAVGLTDLQTRINGNQAVVTGRVVFKGGLPEWQTKESSSGVTIRFSRQEGQWKFVSLCMGKCAAA
jgi:hypothetical protein